jgi:tRNA (adenine37-N6)-methyltransferase
VIRFGVNRQERSRVKGGVMHPIFPIDDEGNIKIRPIGHVRSPIKEPQIGGLTDIETEVILGEDCSRLLEGIDDFSHIIVVYWLDRITEYRESCRPQGNENVPLLGQLATR